MILPFLAEKSERSISALIDHSSPEAFVQTVLAALGLPVDVDCNMYRVAEASVPAFTSTLDEVFSALVAEAEAEARAGAEDRLATKEMISTNASGPPKLLDAAAPTDGVEDGDIPGLAAALENYAELLYVRLNSQAAATDVLDALLVEEDPDPADLIVVELTAQPVWAGVEKFAEGTVVRAMSERFGMPFASFSGTANPAFGNLILSRHPIIQAGIVWFPSGADESEDPDPWIQRSAALATVSLEDSVLAAMDVAAGGQSELRVSLASALPAPEILVISTHFSDVSEKNRLRQAKALVTRLHDDGFSMGLPIFLCGDLNSVSRGDYTEAQWRENDARRAAAKREPGSSDVTDFLAEVGFLDTLWQLPNPPRQGQVAPTCVHGTRIDYIYVSDALYGCTRSARVVRMENTDHSAYECFVDLSLRP